MGDAPTNVYRVAEVVSTGHACLQTHVRTLPAWTPPARPEACAERFGGGGWQKALTTRVIVVRPHRIPHRIDANSRRSEHIQQHQPPDGSREDHFLGAGVKLHDVGRPGCGGKENMRHPSMTSLSSILLSAFLNLVSHHRLRSHLANR